jgi:hypothetical protein
MKGTAFRGCGKTSVFEEYGASETAEKLRSLKGTGFRGLLKNSGL